MIKRRLYLILISLFVLTPLLVGQAASLFMSPGKVDSAIGKTISVGVYASSKDEALNAVSGSIAFPIDKLSVESLSVGGSVVNFWLKEPSFSNSDGTIRFEGIALNPGFKGNSGRIFSINFKVKAGGEANLRFSSGSILANDGNATEILSGMSGAKVVVAAKTEPGVSDATNPNDTTTNTASSAKPTVAGLPEVPQLTTDFKLNLNNWSSTGQVAATWTLPAGVTGVSYVLDQNPTTLPDTSSEGKTDNFLNNVKDGIWYLHLRFRNRQGWGEAVHKEVMVDRTAPHNFVARVMDGPETYNSEPTVYMLAEDNLSGIDYYRVLNNDQELIKVGTSTIVNNQLKLPRLNHGQASLKFEAVDKAGNVAVSTSSITIKEIAAPIISSYPEVITTQQVLSVLGSSLPNGLVEIVLSGMANESRIIKTDSAGNFNFIENKLTAGDYNLSAIAITEAGLRSAPSAAVNIKVKSFWLGDIMVKTLGGLAFYLPIIILVLMLGLLVLVIKLTRFKRRVLQEAELAENVLSNSHKVLNLELAKIIETLTKAKAKRKLTLEEAKVMRDLKKKLEYTEHFIEPEKIILKKVEKTSSKKLEKSIAKDEVVRKKPVKKIVKTPVKKAIKNK